ncbi:hypothetical protein [Pediococcus pentosaceus]|uniref:hypothetical protein n=1 Tax=Pediococcus pentosaceus TaxID=1255 RepID=UPI00294C3A72|nr:hypothetical protein [Pediococcus pentosaceus]MDV6381041.1 hypothetical protein [Pediococcus pentosaceus]
MSKPYIVSYDLDNPGQKYNELKKIIDAHSIHWCRYLDSTFLIRANDSADDILQALKAVIDSNDSVFIANISNTDYSGWLTDKQWDYIRNNILY